MAVSGDHRRLIRYVASRTAAAQERLFGADERGRSEMSPDTTAVARALELVLAACVRDTAEPVLVRSVEPTIRGRWERPSTDL